MEISFSEKQAKQIFKALAVARWVADVGHDYDIEGEEFEEYYNDVRELVDYVESLPKDPESEKLADNHSDEHHILMESIADLMFEYEESVFSDKLVFKLTERDCIKKYGEAYFEMEPMKRLDKRMEFVKKYEDEIFEHGVEHVGIV
jgi:hypothetical protein